tara:strand:+ start:1261 stop:1815 length:555 start_codon:yes stop_codon:yes gene_type:complete
MSDYEKKPFLNFELGKPVLMEVENIEPFWSGTDKHQNEKWGYNAVVYQPHVDDEGVKHTWYASTAQKQIMDLAEVESGQVFRLLYTSKKNSNGEIKSLYKLDDKDKYEWGYDPDATLIAKPMKDMLEDPSLIARVEDARIKNLNSPIGAGFAQKDDKLSLHELLLRVETLEKEVAELKKNVLPF